MTVTGTGPEVATEAAGGATTGTGFLRRHRWTLAIGAAVVLAFAVAVWSSLGTERYSDPYDPQNPGPEGAQALAEVLENQGVDLTIVRSADELEDAPVDGDTTVVVTGAERLSSGTAQRLVRHAEPGDLVVVEPPHWVLRDLGAPRGQFYDEAGDYPADCAEPTYDGLSLTVDSLQAYEAGPGGLTCFPAGGGHALVGADGGIVLFGAGQALTNDQILRGDNAAVALRMLGQDERLVWYLPSYDDATAGEAVSLRPLLPDWLEPALWTALLALVGLVLWRVRRLGPLSTEPLPVVVRAAETTRSRGRMYRRARDRAHAAHALRAAARRRLAARLRLGRGVDDATVVTAVAHHLGRTEQEIGWLLSHHAPAPGSDHELVRLTQELARLDREVRRA